jgi:tetratricopeptide (TPR) repeat protein
VKSALLVALVWSAAVIAADRTLPEIYREAKSALESGNAARCAELLEPALKDLQAAPAEHVASAHLALGLAWLRLGKAEAAASALKNAATAYAGTPHAPDALAPLGDAFRATAKIEDARRAYAEAVESAGESINAQYAKARLSELEGERLQAAGEWANAANAYLAAADLLLRLGADDGDYLAHARALYEKVAKGTGTSGKDWRGEPTARAVYGLGEVERVAGQLPEAIAYYQRTFVSWVRYPQWPGRSYLRAAECMDKLGKRDLAIRHLRELVRKVEKYGKLPEYQQAKAQLRAWGEQVR